MRQPDNLSKPRMGVDRLAHNHAVHLIAPAERYQDGR